MPEQAQDELTLEQALEQLEATVSKLEEKGTSLEESFQIYQSGMKLLKQCNAKIDRVEKKMLLMEENGEIHEF